MERPFLTGDDAWQFNSVRPSNSWGGAHNFYNHWKGRATLAPNTNHISVGDPINADFTKDGDIDHTAIISSLSSGHFYLTQHTTDRKDSPFSTWFNSGYNVFAWKMSTAKMSPND